MHRTADDLAGAASGPDAGGGAVRARERSSAVHGADASGAGVLNGFPAVPVSAHDDRDAYGGRFPARRDEAVRPACGDHGGCPPADGLDVVEADGHVVRRSRSERSPSVDLLTSTPLYFNAH